MSVGSVKVCKHSTEGVASKRRNWPCIPCDYFDECVAWTLTTVHTIFDIYNRKLTDSIFEWFWELICRRKVSKTYKEATGWWSGKAFPGRNLRIWCRLLQAVSDCDGFSSDFWGGCLCSNSWTSQNCANLLKIVAKYCRTVWILWSQTISHCLVSFNHTCHASL